MAATVASKTKIFIKFFVRRVLPDRRVGKLPKGSSAPEWKNLPFFRSTGAIFCHTEGFNRYVEKRLGLSSSSVDAVLNKRVNYFVKPSGLYSYRMDHVVIISSWILDSPSSPGKEWTLSATVTDCLLSSIHSPPSRLFSLYFWWQ